MRVEGGYEGRRRVVRVGGGRRVAGEQEGI